MEQEANDLQSIRNRILEISYKHKLSHIASCLTQVEILYSIYKHKKRDDIVILSAGHSGVALYCVLEHFYGFSAENLFKDHGVHPNRDKDRGIFASSGSLGHGIGIAVGAAFAYPNRKISVISTDGEMAEGSCWESLRIADELNLKNFHLYINANGYSGYSATNTDSLIKSLNGFIENIRSQIMVIKTSCTIPFLEGLTGHYAVMSEEQYKSIC